MRVLKWQPDSEWALPTFIIPKKDNTVCVVSDLREVNKWIVRKTFLIPKSALFNKNLNKASYMPQPLILTQAIIPLDWIQSIQNMHHHYVMR